MQISRRRMLAWTGAGVLALPGTARAASGLSTSPDAVLSLDFRDDAYSHPAATLSGLARRETEEGSVRRLGARIEAAGRNHAWTSVLAGASVGPIHDAGALPDGWRFVRPEGVRAEVLAISQYHLRLRIFGNARSDGEVRLAFSPVAAAPAMGGQVWTGSFECQAIRAGGTVEFYSWFGQATSRRRSEVTFEEPFAPQDDVAWPVESQWSAPTAAGLSHGLGLRVVPGEDFDVTVRVGRPQLEESPFRTSFMATHEGQGGRPADELDLQSPFEPGSTGDWAAVTGFRHGRADAGVVREWATGSDDERLTLFIKDHLVKIELATAGGAPETRVLDHVCRYGQGRVALSINGGRLAARMNGGGVVTLPAPSGRPAADRIGHGAHGALGGWISDVAIYDRALDDRELLTLSGSGAALSDGFDRGDRPLTGDQAASGQIYEGVELGDQAAVSLLTIESGAVIAPASGAAVTRAYSGVTFDQPPAAMRGIGRLAPGEGGDAWVFIANAQGLDDVTDITAGSFHMVFSGTQADLGYFDAGSLIYVATPAYARPLESDGRTAHAFGVRISGDAAILEMPDGRLLRYRHAALIARAEPHWTMEIFRFATGEPRCAFLAVEVEAAP